MAALSRPAQDALSTIRRMFSPGGQLDAVCIPRILINLTGDLESAAILSKLIYWADKGADTEGWIYKTARDWQADIGVSYFRLAKRVKELGLYIEVKTRKVNGTPKSHYRVNLPALLSALLDSQETRKSRNSKIEKLENRGTSMSEIEETRKSEIEVSQKSYIHESTTFNTSQERDKSLSPVTEVTGEVSPQEAPNKSSKPEKAAKALSLTCGCGQTLDATREQAQAAGWKVPTSKAALPECPTCVAEPDPLFVWTRKYLGLLPTSTASDRFVGVLVGVLVRHEKERLGIGERNPLTRQNRRDLAAVLDGFNTWYVSHCPGATLPRTEGKFSTWIGQWFNERQAASAPAKLDTRPVSGAPLPDGYVRVSARPAQEPSPPSDEEPEHDPYEAFTRLVANRQTIPTARREQTKAGE